MTTQDSPDFDPLLDQLPSRYIVGIDLGTTNCAVSFVDTQATKRQIKILPIPQLISPAVVESRDGLPSFHFQPASGQLSDGALKLPWDQKTSHSSCVGVMAHEESAKTSGRVISSAKSWLSHAGVDRTAALLPWQSAADVKKLSPVEVSSQYLGHIRDVWNDQFPNERLEDQDVVLTLPASFDEIARELTVQAAAEAKLPRVILIEEPQAAFYSWVDKNSDTWQQQVSAGQTILVCDIGGGTTDFTLIRVRAAAADKVTGASGHSPSATTEAESGVQFHRVAVGKHLILGGDNLDLALAKWIEQNVTDGGQLPAQQWEILVGASRSAKEILLAGDAPEQVTVNLPAAGSKLIGGSLTTQVTQTDVQQQLVDGFLPPVPIDAKPEVHQSGFQEFGLPYASDPAITRHLAAFLTAHAETAESDSHAAARPDIVLFNGGFFASPILRQRLIDVLVDWFGDTEANVATESWQPIVLENERLDLAVARGAAYYGLVQRGEGVRIAASLARSYYLAIDDAQTEDAAEPNTCKAVCLVPGDANPGTEFELDSPTFQLTLAQPVAFSLLSSSVRLTDQPGDIVDIESDQMTPLPPVRTVISGKSKNEKRDIPVRLHIELTEIGTLKLSCHEVDSERSWKLDFDIRSTTQTNILSHAGTGEAEGFMDESTWQKCHQAIAAVFASDNSESSDPKQLMNTLAELLEMDRDQWPMSVLRRIWESLLQFEVGRKQSSSHESRWLNMLGFSLRPGYGYALDDWRVTETWRAIHGKLAHHTPTIRKESLILWRRLAGGLTRGQQISLASKLLPAVRNLKSQLDGQRVKGIALKPEESPEVWRLLASLELLPINDKRLLGNLLTDLLTRKSFEKVRSSIVWALGRLGQRVPVYGNLNTLVPPNDIGPWVEQLLALSIAAAPSVQSSAQVHLATTQMTRLTGDRFRDIDPDLRQQVIKTLNQNTSAARLVSLIEHGGHFDAESQQRILGDSLPAGLKIL